MTVQNIEQLGNEIEQAWRGSDYREEAFAEIAQAALAKRALHRELSAVDVARWLHRAPQVPPQAADAKFGEPPVTLFAGRHFYVEVLFWLDGTTAIHQHSFSGAFHVLFGSSIHTRYTFTPGETISDTLLLGELRAGKPELLAAGDTRPILAGNRLIHSLFHLERPSATLVVRTRHAAGTDPQYSYLPPGIAHDPFGEDARLPRLQQLFEVLRHAQSPERSQLLREVIEGADLHSCAILLVNLFRAQAIKKEESDALLAVLAGRHAALASALALALNETRRQALVIDRRRTLHSPDHRFFLSLLLNIRRRDEIFRLIDERYADAGALDRIVGWIEEITSLPPRPGSDSNEPNPIGYDLGEAEIQVFRALLAGRTPDEVVTALAAQYDGVMEQADDVHTLCESIQTSALFRPLFENPTL
ncbi:MAG: hypothetical protein JWN44_4475 [Myxococcales bacterium]|nr:hypothetical protein [Myxococcales bacterium]